jgi:hypothetical protein
LNIDRGLNLLVCHLNQSDPRLLLFETLREQEVGDLFI